MSCNNCGSSSIVKGQNVDIFMDQCGPEIRADITLIEYSTIRIWGQVKNFCGKPIIGVLLKLVKVFNCNCKEEYYEGISHTTSDDNGFYQFDICANDPHKHYKILANKSVL